MNVATNTAPPALAADPDIIANFLADTITRDIHLVAIDPTKKHVDPIGRWFGEDVQKAVAFAVQYNGYGWGIYWTVNVCKQGLNKKPHGGGNDPEKMGDMVAHRFLHVDIDPPKDGRPWSLESTAAELAALRYPPSFTIASGGGLGAFWRLDEAVCAKAEVTTANRGLAERLGGDHCHNHDRVMRLPGTVNYPDAVKAARGRVPAPAFVFEPDDGVVYPMHALVAEFPSTGKRSTGNASETAAPDDFALITADDLDLSAFDPLRSLIDHPAGADRSADAFACAGRMHRDGYSDAQIMGVLMNPANAVSAHIFDQRDPRYQAARTLNNSRPVDGRDRDPAPRADEKADWPKPVNLWARFTEPELPMDLLPPLIERFAVKQGEIMGADPAGLAMAALTVCAAAIPDSIAVQVKRNDPTFRENARLWTALVGPPSRKKTPIFKAAIAPLRTLDNHLMRTFMLAMQEYEALPTAERKGASRPKQKRLIISDSTVEAAQEVLRDSPDGVLSEQDELSGWFGAMDKYAPGKGAQADRAFWLKAFNGGTYNLNRITRGASQIPNLSISLLGGIQPEPIRKLAGDTMDDGLIQRLLPVILKSSDIGRDVPNDDVIREYEELVGRLHLMKPPERSGFSSVGDYMAPLPVKMSTGALAIRERLEAEHLALSRALETASPKLAAHFGKYDGIFARFCLIWHCIECDGVVPAAEVSEGTAERVARFMEDFTRPSAIAFYAGLLGMSAGHEDLVALASLIVARGLSEVKARDAQSSTQSFRSMNAEDFRLLCEKLASFGWLEKGEPGPKSNTPRWIVNPLVHTMFAVQAEAEAKRRAEVREVLRAALQA